MDHLWALAEEREDKHMIFYAGYNPRTLALLGIQDGKPFDAMDIRSVKLWLVKKELEEFLESNPNGYEVKKVRIIVT